MSSTVSELRALFFLVVVDILALGNISKIKQAPHPEWNVSYSIWLLIP